MLSLLLRVWKEEQWSLTWSPIFLTLDWQRQWQGMGDRMVLPAQPNPMHVQMELRAIAHHMRFLLPNRLRTGTG